MHNMFELCLSFQPSSSGTDAAGGDTEGSGDGNDYNAQGGGGVDTSYDDEDDEDYEYESSGDDEYESNNADNKSIDDNSYGTPYNTVEEVKIQ